MSLLRSLQKFIHTIQDLYLIMKTFWRGIPSFNTFTVNYHNQIRGILDIKQGQKFESGAWIKMLACEKYWCSWFV